jgi:hypothetical protein
MTFAFDNPETPNGRVAQIPERGSPEPQQRQNVLELSALNSIPANPAPPFPCSQFWAAGPICGIALSL